MSKAAPKNIPASVRQRLLNVAKTTDEEFQALLTRFALERLLYRLGKSPHRDGVRSGRPYNKRPEQRN